MPSSDVIPRSYLVWDNQARFSLSPPLLLWLTFLVSTVLYGSVFVKTSIPARWALGGFILEHLIVIANGSFGLFTMRYGIVSLLHLICWSPGWIVVIFDSSGQRGGNKAYIIWSLVYISVLGIAFIFDARDAVVYTRYALSLCEKTTENEHSTTLKTPGGTWEFKQQLIVDNNT